MFRNHTILISNPMNNFMAYVSEYSEIGIGGLIIVVKCKSLDKLKYEFVQFG